MAMQLSLVVVVQWDLESPHDKHVKTRLAGGTNKRCKRCNASMGCFSLGLIETSLDATWKSLFI
jgi:hypothetical protein